MCWGLEWLLAGKESRVFNLGTGSGFSVKEVIGHARAATGHRVPHRYGPRRGGDATALVSGGQSALNDLGWGPSRSSLKVMIQDAWTCHKTGGYTG